MKLNEIKCALKSSQHLEEHTSYIFREKELYNLSYADLFCSSLLDCTNNLILREIFRSSMG